MTGISQHEYLRGKTSEICRGLVAAVMAIGSSVVKADSPLKRTGNHGCSCSIADIGSPCSSFLFQAMSIYLSFAGLWMG